MLQKQQVNEQIQTEYKKMDDTYLILTKSLHKMYIGYQCFDTFDITTVDYWLGDVACCYDGDNYDLSNELFAINEKLVDIEATQINKQQLVEIYNMLVVLINDQYACEEQIFTKTDISQNDILDKLKILTQKLIVVQNTCASESTNDLCKAVQKLYTLLDFSLYDSDVHMQLRQLKETYLETQANSYNTIRKCQQKIEEMDKLLEKHGYSEEGKKVSKREIAPFPTLKAYNNAMTLLGCCLTAVENYEKESGLIIPSSLDDISEVLLEKLIRTKAEFDEWDDSVDFNNVAHALLANTTFDMLISGQYHIYTGVLDPLNCSSYLMLIYEKSMEYAVEKGLITTEDKENQHNHLKQCISKIG